MGTYKTTTSEGPFVIGGGKYVIAGNLLGRGSYGTVFEGINQFTGKPVAIKKMDNVTLELTRSKDRALKEAEIHSRLHHPSIVKLHDYFEQPEAMYLVSFVDHLTVGLRSHVMECCKGGCLSDYIKKQPNSRLSDSEARKFFRQLIEGVIYLHSNRIMHRDLKLQNLLLTDSKDLKICDFGLSVQLKDEEDLHKTVCGTPNYLSPEICQYLPYSLGTGIFLCHCAVDNQSDVWSLGIILYILLEGKSPFQGKNRSETMTKVVTTKPKTSLHVSAEAVDLLSKMLEKDPSQRITLEDVLYHPWLSRSHLATQSLSISNVKSSSMSPEITTGSASSYRMDLPDRLVSYVGNALYLLDQQPFNTTRLKAFRQETKHGSVEILDTGETYLRNGAAYNFVISKDGLVISLIDKISDRLVEQHLLNKLPQEYHRVYNHISRFVNIIKTRTAKVTLYSGQCRASLMESMNDFEANFPVGLRLHCDLSSSKWTTLQIAPEVAEMKQHAQKCLEFCQNSERASSLMPGLNPFPTVHGRPSASGSSSLHSSLNSSNPLSSSLRSKSYTSMETTAGNISGRMYIEPV